MVASATETAAVMAGACLKPVKQVLAVYSAWLGLCAAVSITMKGI